ncbi:MAG: metal-sensitive transcriptional regulator [Patescibacteria group bacterium]
MPKGKTKSSNSGVSRKGGIEGCNFTNIQARLHRVRGQIGGIEKMIANKKDCLSVLQQVVACREALRKVAIAVLQQEAQGCFKDASGRKSIGDLEKIVEALFKAT